MPPFLIFVLVLAGIWTLSGITTWLGKQKEAERRQRLREQMARAGVNVPIAPPAFSQGVQTPRQISAAIANRFPDVLLPPSPQRQPQKVQQPRRIQQRRPPQVRQTQQRASQPPMRTLAPPKIANMGVRRPQQPVRPQAPAAPALLEIPAMAVQRTGTTAPIVQSSAKTATTTPRMTAASLARWMSPRTLNQQFLLSEIFQPPLGMRDPSAGM